MREIRFAWICKNIHFDEIERIELTDNMLLNGSRPSWITTDNCEIIAKILPTGLEDCNGKAIWEDDILEFILDLPLSRQQTRRGVVEWNDTLGSWIVDFPAYGEGHQFYELTDTFGPSECKVIGNCHENPELLEEILGD